MQKLLIMVGTLFLLSFGFAKEVRIYNWTDYIDPELLDEFTEKTGINVIYDTFDSNELLLAKVLTGNSNYDIVPPTDYTTKYLIEADKLHKIEKDRLKNYHNIWPFVTEKLEEIAGVNEYSIPYMWGTTGVAYNVDKIASLIPGAPTDSLALMFDPQYAEKLSSCGIYMLDSPSEAFPMAFYYLGLSPESTSDEDLAKVEALFDGIRPYIKKFHSSEYINALANGDACIALAWSGDAYQAKTRAEEAGQGVQLDYFIPKEGAILWFDQFAILKDAQNIDGAYAFIDFMLDPENNARAANYVEYSTSNQGAFPYVEPYLLEDETLYPSETLLKEGNLNVKQPYSQKEQKKVMKLWLKIKNR